MKEFLEQLYRIWSEFPPQSRIQYEFPLLGRYRIQNLLGVGGTSLVVSAHDIVLDRIVAIKIWNPYISTQDWRAKEGRTFYLHEIEHFRQEAQRLATLKHPNFCEVYDFGVSAEGIPWIVMELFNGISLRGLLYQWISKSQRHSIEYVLQIAQSVAVAVAFLHKKGLYQLDVKPENILVDGNSVKIIDIASGLEKPTHGYRIKQARYGTPGYVAPEIVTSRDAKSVGPPADVFSLGVIMLEMCCLHNPLASEALRRSAYEALGIVEKGMFVDHSTANVFPDGNSKLRQWGESYASELLRLDIRGVLNTAPLRVPAPLIGLIAQTMALDVALRPRNADEVLRELVRISSAVHYNAHDYQSGDATMTEPITVLFLAADPTDASRLRLGQEYREIQEKLKLAKMRDRFKLEQRLSVRPVDISQSILDEKPSIVHFSGHGTSEGSLCFENEMGESRPVQPHALAALFELVSREVSCVLLNACYSETQANAIAKHIKYVIGMRKAIGDKAAIAFAVGFYQALGAGKSIEESFRFGCVQIRLQGIPEHLTPVLVTRQQ